jgi:precorrin-2 dehydrogenase/sirohydrochlorin ferrochelatase
VSAYPLVLDGARLEALVVGGGEVAARKVGALLDAGATVRVVATALGAPLRAMASRSCLTMTERAYVPDDIGGALLIIAATDDRETNARVARDAHALSRLVNVTDVPDEGNCVTPAVHRAGELVVAVTAGGVPGAAARVRDAIGERMDGRYANAVGALAELRRRLLGADERERWHRASRELVGDDFCEAVEQGTLVGRVRAWR